MWFGFEIPRELNDPELVRQALMMAIIARNTGSTYARLMMNAEEAFGDSRDWPTIHRLLEHIWMQVREVPAEIWQNFNGPIIGPVQARRGLQVIPPGGMN